MNKRKLFRIVAMSFVVSLLLTGCVLNHNSHNSKTELKVLTVEFGSRTPIPNMYVEVQDVETGKIVDTVLSNKEGEAVVPDLQDGKQYVFRASHSQQESAVGEVRTISADDSYIVLESYYVREEQDLAVPVVLQNPELPHGCEVTSLTAVLNYYGLGVSKTELADHYLPQQTIRKENGKNVGPDPSQIYAGNPRDQKTGTYVFAPAIQQIAQKIAKEKNSPLVVENSSGKSKEEILSYIKEGVPVVIWVTLDLSEPRKSGGWWIENTNTYHDTFRNLHAVVLTGHVNEKVIVMDPLHGYVSHDEATFFKSYQELGAQAVAIRK